MTIQRLLSKLVSLTLICVLLTQSVFSQTKSITGKITDDKGNPLAGVSVSIKGSRTGTSTDVGGNFTLNVKTTATTLVLTSIGFADKEVDITSQTSIAVSMVPSSTTLGDLVVTGYGSTRKKVTSRASRLARNKAGPNALLRRLGRAGPGSGAGAAWSGRTRARSRRSAGTCCRLRRNAGLDIVGVNHRR